MTATVKLEQVLNGLIEEEDIRQLVESFCEAVEHDPLRAIYCHQLPLPERDKMMGGLFALFSWLLLGKSGEMPESIYSSLKLSHTHISRQWQRQLHQAIEEQFTGILAELVKEKFAALDHKGSVDIPHAGLV
ncbi:hypothetical protein TH63_02610 [Rufibacter radiotolerans]|uniref:Uncharacterized protein n=1 Tax=Rufibacter radiotolerans TaxID=1379910 RepID=A0A0H4VM00_9BACT|nr:hypothetical protein [Rufibacter radiotolerans]AKQ44764.1 hypothetical protein TH63_02610 [Rufibacter radiotolerans]